MKTDAGLDILNVGRGDFEINFDPANEADLARAKAIIPDLLKRGYALMVEIDGRWSRVHSFDPTKGEYTVLLPWETDWEGAPAGNPETSNPPKAKRGRPRKTVIPMNKVRATAVGRTAGG